jgi:hypothetical protein
VVRLAVLSEVFPYDFAINWTAALALRQGVSIYDNPALQKLSIIHVGPIMATMFDQTFENYIGPPTTAVLHLPFTFLPFQFSLWIARGLIVVTALAAIWLAAQAVPKASRWLSLSVGVLALLVLQSFSVSLILGQVDHWIMLGLGLSVWAARHSRWTLMGHSIGLAALLKVSPVVVLLYTALRGKLGTLWGAIGFVAVAIGLTLPFGPGLWLQFAQEVAPHLSVSTLSIENQSWLGYWARMISPETDLYQTTVPLGLLARLAPLVAIGLITVIFLAGRRSTSTDWPLIVGLLILAALMTGPITWDSYISWAAIALIPIADQERWRNLTPAQQLGLLMIALFGAVLASIPLNLLFFRQEVFAEHSWLRLLTGPRTIAVTLWFGVGLVLLRSASKDG